MAGSEGSKTQEESPASEDHKQNVATTHINELKQQYGSNCKIIKNVGDFLYIVKLKMEGVDLAIHFQIDGDYPSSSSNMAVKSDKVSAAQRAELQTTLHERQQMTLLETVTVAIDWLKDRNIDIQEQSTPEVKKKNKKSSPKKIKSQDAPIHGKASPMKTAEDVIHRILWDESLPNEHFSIGYIDRFLGVVEKPFSVFSWEDLASVDYDVLAIPKHRIQYFSYKGQVVWDKIKRLDLVFGSTGDSGNIHEVMEMIDNLQLPQNPEASFNEDSDDDSDDDIVIDTGCQRYDADEQEPSLYPREKYWGKRVRPTHFLALRITNPEILAKIKEIQELILDLEPSYVPCVIPVERLHMTLCCIGLDTEDQVKKAVEVLQSSAAELATFNEPPINLHFRSVDQFHNNTLYARATENDRIEEFVEQTKVILSAAGVEIREIYDFVPHMTILKLSMQYGRDMKTRYLDPRLMHMLSDIDFGSQILDNVHLCAMSEDRQADGFYDCATQITLT